VETDGPETFPGAATAANLWEGVGVVSADITSSFGDVRDKFPFSRELVSVEAGLQYCTRLAERCAHAYARCGSPVPVCEARILHLGCGVGGVTYALARHFGSVVGVDASEPSVRHGRVLQHHGQLEYERVEEGVLTQTALVKLESVAQRSRMQFILADYDALPAEVTCGGPFDAVFVDGVLERMTQPLHLITKLPCLVKECGLLLVSSSNDWDPKYTPRNSWLGGFKMNGEDMSTQLMLRYNLKKAFKFIDADDVTKLTRLHHRKYDLTVLETTAWQRVSASAPPAPAAAAAAPLPEPVPSPE